MSLTIVLIAAAVLSLVFHFVGVYVGAKKTIWVMLVFVWTIAIGTAMNEIKPSGYKSIERMKGQFADTDKLIEESMPEISLYEMLSIKKNYLANKPKE